MASSSTIELSERDEMKFVMLGTGAVGKSSITIQFIKGEYRDSYNPTIEDAYTKQCSVDSRPVKINLLDTAGQEEFTAMRDQYMREGDGFVLVYSVTDASSFQEVQDIYSQLLRSRDVGEEGIPVVFLGNKCDLSNERAVTYKEGEEFAKQFAKTKFFETSAKANINIENAFHALVRTVRKDRNGEFDHEEMIEEEPVKNSKNESSQKSKRGFGGLFNSCGKQNAESDLAAFQDTNK